MTPRDRLLAAARQILMHAGRESYARDIGRARALELAAMQVADDREAAIALLAAGFLPGDYIWGDGFALPHIEPPAERVAAVEWPPGLVEALAATHVRRPGETDAELRARIGAGERCTGITARWCPKCGDCKSAHGDDAAEGT